MSDPDVQRNEYGQIALPDRIFTAEHAANTALALVEYFEDDDRLLASLANSIQSACRARAGTVTEHSRYGARVTFVDRDGEPHTAIVLEPEVADMAADEAWDPYKEEYVNPREEYPLGTVQLVYPASGQWGVEKGHPERYFFDRVSSLECATSVMPAKEPGETYCYYAGWDYALDHAGDVDDEIE